MCDEPCIRSLHWPTCLSFALLVLKEQEEVGSSDWSSLFSDRMTRVYVGDLSYSAHQGELEREFGRYGPLREVWVARNPPGFAFIEFEDGRDADDAVRDLDGRRICGTRVRVEHSRGPPRGRGRYGGGGGGRRGPPPGER